jgi:hypothetical protein
MSVYVDPAVWPFGRMMMCHMYADSHEELVVMAGRIGVARKWIQYPGTAKEHFDVCKSKRALAVQAGAIEVSAHDLFYHVRRKESPHA